MVIAIRTALILLVWFLLMHPVSASDLFHWTDANGVPHFTNDFSAVPESIRHSLDFTVRKDFFSSSVSDRKPSTPEPLPAAQTQAASEADLLPELWGPALVTDAPQEIVVVINSSAQQPKKKYCFGDNCKRGFRPDFNHRWHVYPRAFAAGSHAFIRR